ncbi:MAG: oxidoreductase [Steroidobacteraceae bacterium]
MSNWDQATWLITGTSSGFGREIARAVLARGGRVVATARRPESLQDLAHSAPDRVLALPLDVQQLAQVQAAVAAAEQRFGGVDVLVNNAGYGLFGTIEHMPEAELRQLFEVNFFGLVAMTRAVLPAMRRRRRGFIVNISSVAGLRGHAGSAFYCASKFAVEGFTEALRNEVAPLGIGAIAIEPGPFRTEFGPSAHYATQIPEDYAASAGVTVQWMSALRGREPGDPARAALAIMDAINMDSPPGQLVLGGDSHARVIEVATRRLAAFEGQRALAATADYPKG